MASPFEDHDAAPILLGSQAYQNASAASLPLTSGTFNNSPAGQSVLSAQSAFNENALPIGVAGQSFNNARAAIHTVDGEAAFNENALPIGIGPFAFLDAPAAEIGTPIAAAVAYFKDENADTFIDPETGGSFPDPGP